MADEITVTVVEFSDRSCYQLQWVDPLTGKKKTKSSGIERTGRKDAEKSAAKAAGALQKELREGTHTEPSRATWEAFTERYTTEVAEHLAASTATKVDATFSLVERLMQPPPKRLADLTASRISEWVNRLLSEKGDDGKPIRTRATVAVYCRHLKAALNWAVEIGLIAKAPAIRPPKQDGGDEMKGRPITTEEYERMLMSVEAALTPEPAKRNTKPPTPPAAAEVAQWQRFLTGLWWSGLRLGEALALSWDESAAVSVVMQPGYRPVFRFKASGQKARRNELVPVAPEFAQMLEETPEAERVGRVFKLPTESISQAGKVLSAIGERAGVVVDHDSGKFASAHDLRRAFGTRWSKRLMPAVLQRLMRHSAIQTTMKYYTQLDADDITGDLWRAFEAKSNISSNTHPSGGQGDKNAVYVKPLPQKG